ncbi:MAG TPA: TonB-dependent receptor [Gemmatimonadaceae bacterium]
MRKLFATVLLLLSPALLSAQASIHGTVSDQQTGSPISGATVEVTGAAASTVTDASGSFTIASSGASTRLTVSAVGYAAKGVVVTDPSKHLYIRLAPAHAELPGVQVMARTAAPSVGILTRQDLERSSGLSLEKSINTMPGVFMQSRTPWGGARITIRGYYPSTSGNSPNSNGLGYQVFLDGIPVTDATGTTVLDDVDYSTLGGVEVIKGPASSQYGSFIGGAVLLATAKPAPNETSFGQQVVSGSNGLVRTNTTFQSAGDHGGLVLNYGHQEYDSFRPHSGSRKDYFRGSADFEVGTNQTLSAYFAYNRSFEELAGEIDSTPFYARIPQSNAAYLANDSHIRLHSFVAGITDQYRLSDRFTNQTSVFGSGRTSNQPFAHGVTDANQFSFGARSAFGYATRLASGIGVNGTLGGSVQRSNVTTNGVFIVPAPPFAQRPTDQENYAVNASVFTEWSVALPARVTVTAGASLNKVEFGIRNMLKDGQVSDTTELRVRSFDWELTPRVAVTKGLGGGASVYASVSSGFTPPLLSNTVANDGTVDLALKPERAVQYEVGAQGSALGDRLSGRVSLFDIENTDKLVSQTVNSVTFTTNAGKQRNRGAELSLGYLAIDDTTRTLSMLRPWVTYAYTDAKFIDFQSDNDADANTVDFSGNAVPRVPRNMVTAGLDVATSQGVYLNGTYQYVDKVPVTFDNAAYVKSYDLLGLKVGYRKHIQRNWVLDLSAGGENLLGSTYYTFLFVGPNYRGLATDADGGRGDGYIIPGAYEAEYYGNIGLRYVF